MALDAAQILRQTYASGAERIDVASLMRQAEPQAVARGELMGTAVVRNAGAAIGARQGDRDLDVYDARHAGPRLHHASRARP